MSLKPNESPEARPRKAAARRLLSRDLLGGAQEVVIEHDGDFYRLRCTSKGKLILTK
ncbi:MAG TPA: hemin uptake protein HemP [Kiloniellaceae bacterium]